MPYLTICISHISNCLIMFVFIVYIIVLFYNLFHELIWILNFKYILLLLCFKVIAQHCVVLSFCGMITKKSIFSKISASTMYANHNICNFKTTLRKKTFGFRQSLEQSTTSIVSSYLNHGLLDLIFEIVG